VELIENGNSKAVLLEMADKDDCAAKHDSRRSFFSKLAVSDPLRPEKSLNQVRLFFSCE